MQIQRCWILLPTLQELVETAGMLADAQASQEGNAKALWEGELRFYANATPQGSLKAVCDGVSFQINQPRAPTASLVCTSQTKGLRKAYFHAMREGRPFLLAGGAGTGKTYSAKEIVETLGFQPSVIRLSSSTSDVVEVFRDAARMGSRTPVIIDEGNRLEAERLEAIVNNAERIDAQLIITYNPGYAGQQVAFPEHLTSKSSRFRSAGPVLPRLSMAMDHWMGAMMLYVEPDEVEACLLAVAKEAHEKGAQIRRLPGTMFDTPTHVLSRIVAEVLR